MNSLQKSTITELDTIFEHIKLCIFKDSEAAIASETTLSQTNGNNFITTFLNTNDTLFTTNEARLEYINEYENINNYIDNNGNLLDVDLINPIYEKNPYYLNLKVKFNIVLSTARLADDFELIYSPKFASNSILIFFNENYSKNLKYLYSTIYVKGMDKETNYRNMFQSVTILGTMISLLNQKFKTPFDIKILDNYAVDNYMYSMGIPFFKDLPIRFKKLLFVNLNKLISNKGTTECLLNILEIFDFQNIEIYKHYLVKRFCSNDTKFSSLSTDARFYIVNIKETSLQNAIKKNNYETETFANEILDDTFWEASKNEVENVEFDFVNSKYMSISANYNLFEEVINMVYCLNFLKEVENSFSHKNAMTFTSIDIGTSQYEINDLVLAMNILCTKIFNLPDTIDYASQNKNTYSFKMNKSFTTNPVVNLNTKLTVDQNTANESLSIDFASKFNLEQLMEDASTFDSYKILKKDYDEKMQGVYNLSSFSPYLTYSEYLANKSPDIYNFVYNNLSTELTMKEALDVLLNILLEFISDIKFSLVLNGDILITYIEVLTQIINVFKSFTVTLRQVELKAIIKEKIFFKFRENLRYKINLLTRENITFSDMIGDMRITNNSNKKLIFGEKLVKRVTGETGTGIMVDSNNDIIVDENVSPIIVEL